MSFLDSMRRLFGMDTDYNTDEMHDQHLLSDGTSDEPTDNERSEGCPQPVAAVEGLLELPTRPVVDPDMKSKIFEGVVAIFNEALPDFLRHSVDPQRQSALIAESLDKSLIEYLDSLSSEAANYAEAMLKNAADNAKREADRLRREMENLEQQRTSLREQQLSAERRRRALADRVQDLEAQLASAEAEREQFDLEKKSMLNKIKLADVQPGIIEDLQREIERLRNDQTAPQPDTATVDALSTELEETRAKLEEMSARLEETAAALENANNALDQQKEQAENSQGMYNDMQHQLVEEREARVKAEQEVAEARKIYESVIEMQKQMQQVEVMIQKRDDRIARLKSTNKKLKEELAELREELASNPKHLDGGLFDLIEDEPEIHPSAEEEAAMASLEDDFECPDWFVSQPAPGEGSLRVSDEPFGYTPPVRKPTPENDAQLLLF